jgi:hypothetical protein
MNAIKGSGSQRKHVLTFGLRQLQGPCDRGDGAHRHIFDATLLEHCVPAGAYLGDFGHFFPTQAAHIASADGGL